LEAFLKGANWETRRFRRSTLAFIVSASCELSVGSGKIANFRCPCDQTDNRLAATIHQCIGICGDGDHQRLAERRIPHGNPSKPDLVPGTPGLATLKIPAPGTAYGRCLITEHCRAAAAGDPQLVIAQTAATVQDHLLSGWVHAAVAVKSSDTLASLRI
jgi:hypothetical protein